MTRRTHHTLRNRHAAARIAATWLLLFSAYIPSLAQRELATISSVRSDSILFLDRDITNLQLFPLLVDQEVSPQPFALPKRPLPEAVAHWQNEVAPHLNAVGSFGETTQSEGYTAVANLYEAASLWFATGEGAYIDAVEKALFGALPATMFSSPDAVERAVAAQAMIDASQIVYATDSLGLYVNFYLNTFAHIVTTQGQTYNVDISTTMPWGGMMKLRIRTPQQQAIPLTLRLRIPSWVDEAPAIYVDGIEQDYTVERGYALIHRTWKYYDEVYMLFNVVPKPTTLGGRTRWSGGPITYCMEDTACAPSQYDIELLGEDAMTHHPVYALTTTQQADTTQLILRPYMDLPPQKRRIWHQQAE